MVDTESKFSQKIDMNSQGWETQMANIMKYIPNNKLQDYYFFMEIANIKVVHGYIDITHILTSATTPLKRRYNGLAIKLKIKMLSIRVEISYNS